jgi:hypothetical protein
MIRRLIKKRTLLFAVLFATFLAQSCNRGVGCPTKFSVWDIPGEILQVVALIF